MVLRAPGALSAQFLQGLRRRPARALMDNTALIPEFGFVRPSLGTAL
jgi:hypothetical protein